MEESNELFIFGSVIKEIKISVATHFIHTVSPDRKESY